MDLVSEINVYILYIKHQYLKHKYQSMVTLRYYAIAFLCYLMYVFAK